MPTPVVSTALGGTTKGVLVTSRASSARVATIIAETPNASRPTSGPGSTESTVSTSDRTKRAGGHATALPSFVTIGRTRSHGASYARAGIGTDHAAAGTPGSGGIAATAVDSTLVAPIASRSSPASFTWLRQRTLWDGCGAGSSSINRWMGTSRPCGGGPESHAAVATATSPTTIRTSRIELTSGARARAGSREHRGRSARSGSSGTGARRIV